MVDMKDVVCYVHRDKIIPRAFAHQHHKIPRGAGGTDHPDNLVFLCTDCHTALHQLAVILKAGRTGEMLDLLGRGYPQPKERKALLGLATLVAESFVAKREGDIPTDEHLVPVMLEHKVFRALQTLAKERKHHGRRIGVARYIRALIYQDFRKRGIRIDFQP